MSGARDAEVRSPVENQGVHGAQRFDMEPQLDCRERRLNIAQRAGDRAPEGHHVHREAHFRFEALPNSASAGDESIHLIPDRSRIDQKGMPSFRQLRSAGALAIEQSYSELCFQAVMP